MIIFTWFSNKGALFMDRKKILVLGIGNLLFKDDGIGLHVVEKLKTMDMPPDVELIEGGVAALNIVYLIENRQKVIVIDSMKADGPPGTIYRLVNHEIVDKRRNALKTAAEAEFVEYYGNTRLLGTTPRELVFIGVEPEDTGNKDGNLEIGLSPVLEKKLPELIEMVMKEISS
jgi:hydrogenase maturation protease